MPEVSIIIPVVRINDYIRESIPYILKMHYQDFEIIIFPDEAASETYNKTRIIPTGKMGPAEKRDLAIKHAKGRILAFLDDDAYPEPDWLDEALPFFNDESIHAVGGPAITPHSDSFWQRVSGAVFLTLVGGGNPDRYWPVGEVKEVDDWPTVNLLVRKDIFEKVGGFDSNYWPGEDTKFCLDLIEAGGRIIYTPKAKVWHHRRSGLKKHLIQVGSYGIHRGFFAKRYPKTSFKVKYFIPTFFDLYVLSIIVTAIFFPQFILYSLMPLILYVGILIYAFVDILKKERNVLVSFFSVSYILLTHTWYGARFFQGFVLTKQLISKLRK